MVQSMMNLTALSLTFWDYALETATHILNMVPTKKGCEALVKQDTPDKLQQRSVKCIFIGYPKETMGYYFYFPLENKIFVAREIPIEVEGFEPPQKEVVPICRSARTHRTPDRLCLNVGVEEHSLGDLNEPTNYKAVMLDLESDKCLDAINAEMQSIKGNQVWRVVDLPPNGKIVGGLYLELLLYMVNTVGLGLCCQLCLLVAVMVSNTVTTIKKGAACDGYHCSKCK
nr:hypothetical protein [Tanacetum cinerariifolium]